MNGKQGWVGVDNSNWLIRTEESAKSFALIRRLKLACTKFYHPHVSYEWSGPRVEIYLLWVRGLDENRLTGTALSEVSAMSFAWRGCQHLNQWRCRQLLSPTPCLWRDAPFFLKNCRKIISSQLLSRPLMTRCNFFKFKCIEEKEHAHSCFQLTPTLLMR